MILGFIDEQRVKGRAVESVCEVLRSQGVQIAARTYRAWKHARPSNRDLSDALMIDVLRSKIDKPEGLYGRRKMTAHLRRQGVAVSKRRIDRLMRQLGMNGLVRGRGVRTTIPVPTAARAPDLLDRDFTAEAPNRRWVADFSYSAQFRVMCSWAGGSRAAG